MAPRDPPGQAEAARRRPPGAGGAAPPLSARAAEWARYAAFRTVAALVPILPEGVARRGGEWLGYLSSYVLGRRFARAQSHMARVLGDTADVRRAARRLCASYGRYWSELFWMRSRPTQELLSHLDIIGLEHLEAARAQGRGLVLALAHTGNFEIGCLVAERIGLRGMAIAEALPNRRITQWFKRTREGMGTLVVLTDEPDMRRLIDHLADGGSVGIMADRTFGGHGVPVTFFGARTRLPSAPAALALRTGAPLLPIAAYFKSGRGHTIVVCPAVEIPAAGRRRQRIEQATQRLTESIEELIRAHPTQWHLLQPNWPGDP